MVYFFSINRTTPLARSISAASSALGVPGSSVRWGTMLLTCPLPSTWVLWV